MRNRATPSTRHAALILVAAALGCLLAAPAAMAQNPNDSDAPHWSSASINIDCTSQCHVTHQAEGGALTPSAGNVNLCQSCHTPAGLAGDLPISNADKAVPGTSGTSHAFDVAAVNASLDTQLPLDNEMNLRVMDGNLVCSTCHNQHAALPDAGGESTVRASTPVTALGSTGSVTSGGTYTGTPGVWYLIEIVAAGNEGSARFRYSKDIGLSWFPTGCSSGNLAPCLTADGGNPVALDSGVTVTFATGSFVLDERWEFSASWPFIRRDLAAMALAPDALLDSGDNTTGDTYCRDCHRDWVMGHTTARTWDGNPKSHPVGEVLNASGAGFDRTVPLDGNGAEQGSGGADANPTNDLRFDSSSLVQCLTCHGVHYADSNTLSVDGP